jgi:hypothetical protein
MFHLAVIGAVGVAFLIIRVAIAPEAGMIRGHGTDFLAGIALPSVIWLGFHRLLAGWLLNTLRGKLLLTLSAVISWEGLMPLLSARSTPDWRDAIAYFAGTIVQHLVQLAVKPVQEPLAS